ncbi:MAG: hypothetical protein LUB61_05475 [Eggerthellaceae bacterium]|nr:hypothetical protein [Eggerthellaceae bacterium]
MDKLLSLSDLTKDISKAGYLERMLERNAASYKYYWLCAIIEEIQAGTLEMSYVRLVARMVADVWYPVVYFHLYLGAGDKLQALVEYLRDTYELKNDSEPANIIQVIEGQYSRDQKLRKLVNDRTNNVPYRLIRPFYEDGIRDAKSKDASWNDARTDNVIYGLNRQNAEGCIYRFNAQRNGIEVDPEWAEFIRQNLPVIDGWLDFRLTQYLQARNPSVPSISLKLHRPKKRNLKDATEYWKCAISTCHLREIYSGNPFTEINFDEYGALSIDHFIPWSFVMHDEPWDLVPMFKNTNSSKNDRLPDYDEFFIPFCDQQFEALINVALKKPFNKIVEPYLMLDPEIRHYEDSDRSRIRFQEALTKVINPLYQIAYNQGYAIWSL